MVKVHEFCLCGLKLSTFPKWLSAQVFQNDFLLNCSKVTICSHFQSDYLLKISMMTFCSILKLGLWKCPKVPPNIYIYITCPLGPQKVIKTHSEPLQNEFQGSNFPSCIGQKRPPMAPQRQPTQPRVILWVTEQDLAGQWALASKFHYQDNDALIFDRLWPSWEFPMCNLDMWGVFSGVKFNSKLKLFYGLWQINASIKS